MIKAHHKPLTAAHLALILMLLFFSGQALAGPSEPDGYYANLLAYRVDVAFWQFVEPHYGAFFAGSYGSQQHYLGPGGDQRTCSSSESCISGWSWWGDFRSVLLLPKLNWLWCCGGPPEAWNPSSYQARMWIN